MRKRRGLTLVELLIALIIIGLLGGISTTLLYTFMNNFDQSSQYTTALERGQMVFSTLEPAVLACGWAVPSSPDRFAEAFQADSALGKAGWTSPMTVMDRGGLPGAQLRLVYGVALRKGTDAMVDLIPGQAATVALPGTEIPDLSGAYKGWGAFPSVRYPAQLSSPLAGSVQAVYRGPSPITTARFDPMVLLRTMEVYVQGGTLYVGDNMYPAQPVVRGVEKIYFERLPGDVLRVSVLTRADDTCDPDLQAPVAWPRSNDVPVSADYRHRLVLSVGTWRARNQ